MRPFVLASILSTADADADECPREHLVCRTMNSDKEPKTTPPGSNPRSKADIGESRCIEVSDIVGRSQCSRFGDGWSIEQRIPVAVRFGFRGFTFSTSGAKFRELTRTRVKAFRYPGEALGPSLTGMGANGGFVYFVAGQLYVGLEGGLALGSMTTPTVTTGGYLLSDTNGVDVRLYTGGVPIGYRVPLGRVSLRGELLAGGVLAVVDHAGARTTHSDRLTIGEVSSETLRPLLEQRAAIDLWFTQHISFGAEAGVNLLDLRSTAFGFSLAWHHRAFDGAMSFW